MGDNIANIEDVMYMKYTKQTPKSKILFKKSTKFHVNGVSHNIRFFKPYPFVVQKSKNQKLVDVDENKYIDYWMGHWSLILGHTNADVTKALQDKMKDGWMYGTVNHDTILLSEILQKAVPVAEKIRYVTSGTEATMYALRLARSYTRKKTIAKIDGGWHGYTSDLLKSVNWPLNEPESSGIINEEHLISIPYNDLEGSIKILDTATDLAGIIVEPVLGGGGCIPADIDYLHGLQEYVHKKNALLILDEIVTGFRFHFGPLYTKMKLDPDIITLGKIVGGGLAIGVICGKREIMQYADTNLFEKSKRAYVGGGTFSANPSTMTAGYATLKILENNDTLYSKINGMGEKTRKNIEGLFDGKVKTTGKGSLFMTHFTNRDSIENAHQAFGANQQLLHLYHMWLITNSKIFFLPGKLGAYSYAHTDDDVKKLLSQTEKFINTIDMNNLHSDNSTTYDKAVATKDPTQDRVNLEDLAGAAIQKFKTL